MSQTKSLQFVCLGNICRSPAAQGVMDRLIRSSGSEELVAVDSAGTAGYHIGRPPDSRMIAAAARRGVPLESRAKQFDRQFVRDRSLIVAMDRDNLREILRLADGAPKHIVLFSDFLDDSWPTDVPDPYYGGDEGFEYVLDMLEAGCPSILKRLLESTGTIPGGR